MFGFSRDPDQDFDLTAMGRAVSRFYNRITGYDPKRPRFTMIKFYDPDDKNMDTVHSKFWDFSEQYTEIVQPLPRSAKLRHKAKITDIFDKGKNALVITETKSYDEDDNLLIVNRATTVVRGAGGWGGDP